VDGLCCDSPCGSPCQACDVPGSFGSCTTVAMGLPHGTVMGVARSCTNQNTLPCGGSGNRSPSPPPHAHQPTPPRAPCSSTTQLTNSFCTGSGTCAPASPSTCANNFKCVGSACVTQCNNDNDCASAAFGCVSANKSCVGFCSLDDSKLDECISQ